MRVQHQIGADIMFAFDELTTLRTPAGPRGIPGADAIAGPSAVWWSTSG